MHDAAALPIWVDYTDRSGNRSKHLVTPLSIESMCLADMTDSRWIITCFDSVLMQPVNFEMEGIHSMCPFTEWIDGDEDRSGPAAISIDSVRSKLDALTSSRQRDRVSLDAVRKTIFFNQSHLRFAPLTAEQITAVLNVLDDNAI